MNFSTKSTEQQLQPLQDRLQALDPGPEYSDTRRKFTELLSAIPGDLSKIGVPVLGRDRKFAKYTELLNQGSLLMLHELDISSLN